MTERTCLKTGDIVKSKTGAVGIFYKISNNNLLVFPVINGSTFHKKNDLEEGSLPNNFCFCDLVHMPAPVKRMGRVKAKVIDLAIRSLISDAVERHYETVHKETGEFIPGTTPVRYGGRVYDSEEMKLLVESGLDFWLTSGRFAAQFEQKFAKFLGVRYIMLTNSGSSANLLAISALTAPELGDRRLKPRDEVITIACAFPTTVNPIIQNRLRPVFLDVDIGTYNIHAEDLEESVTPRTKAIVLAHTLGNPFDLDAVMKVCQDHGLWLIEDNCDALGSKYNGRYTGSFGDISTFSFYPAHHMTMGEGGALATNNPLLRKLILSYRDWGRDCWCETGQDNTCKKRFQWQLGELPYGYDHKYIYSHIGYNLKVTEMQAAVGLAQLEKLKSFVKMRNVNWNGLYRALKKYEDSFLLPTPTNNSEPSWFGFILTVRKEAQFTRKDIVEYLEKNKIATRLLFCGNVLRHPAYTDIECCITGKLENTDYIMNNTFWIGVYPGLTKPMLAHVIDTFDKFIKQQQRSNTKTKSVPVIKQAILP